MELKGPMVRPSLPPPKPGGGQGCFKALLSDCSTTASSQVAVYRASRPSQAGVIGRPRKASLWQRHQNPGFPLRDLDDGLYLHVVAFLPKKSLLSFDATCRYARKSHSRACGPWWEMGRRAFQGVEVNRLLFDYTSWPEAPETQSTSECKPNGFGMDLAEMKKMPVAMWRSQVDWKARYRTFVSAARQFLSPFAHEIRNVRWMDQVIGLQWMWSLKEFGPTTAVYTEFEVKHNPDDISVALVDPNDTSRQSVTFSPITGAVIFETRVQESPPLVEGKYMLPLSSFPPDAKFKGLLGVYIKDDSVAFFRKVRRGQWETTGFVRGLSEALGHSTIGLVLALREAGPYRVCIRTNGVNIRPPLDPGRVESGIQLQNTSAWSAL